ncbi:hypothetical protein C8R43DRAFT_1124084 [Mycena crocata]|nr:hypothetical protein C8R43DRAFT_1124084 [Mycena crocata]
MAKRSRRSSGCCCWVFRLIFGVAALGGFIFGTVLALKQTVDTQRELLSRITDATPISGFYGPGAWWAWLITLGMTHGHMFVAVVTFDETRPLEPEWDYDLIGASGYAVAASLDLILKSRAIAHSGDKASESPLLPALLSRSVWSRLASGAASFFRRAGTALFPLIISLIASFFVFHAHEVITQSAPVIWCAFHDGGKLSKGAFPFYLVDFTGWIFDGMRGVVPPRTYWMVAAAICGSLAIVAFLGNLVVKRDVKEASKFGGAWFMLLALISLIPLLPFLFFGALAAVRWFIGWIIGWWPLYILAFFPQMGYFFLESRL